MTIPHKWQKRLSWVPYFNFIFVFVRMFSSFRKKPVLTAYLMECVLMTLSWAVLAVPINLIEPLIPQASKLLLLMMAWLFPVIYVHISIWKEENR